MLAVSLSTWDTSFKVRTQWGWCAQCRAASYTTAVSACCHLGLRHSIIHGQGRISHFWELWSHLFLNNGILIIIDYSYNIKIWNNLPFQILIHGECYVYQETSIGTEGRWDPFGGFLGACAFSVANTSEWDWTRISDFSSQTLTDTLRLKNKGRNVH